MAMPQIMAFLCTTQTTTSVSQLVLQPQGSISCIASTQATICTSSNHSTLSLTPSLGLSLSELHRLPGAGSTTGQVTHAMAASTLHFMMIFVIVVAAAMVVISPVEADRNPYPPPFISKLHFRNKLPAFLNVHCFKANPFKDLFLHPVPPGEEYGWEFQMNFWGTTAYYCKFNYVGTKLWQAFTAWTGPGLFAEKKYIPKVVWEVTAAGFFRAREGFEFTFIHPWRQDPEDFMVEALLDPEGQDRHAPEVSP